RVGGWTRLLEFVAVEYREPARVARCSLDVAKLALVAREPLRELPGGIAVLRVGGNGHAPGAAHRERPAGLAERRGETHLVGDRLFLVFGDAESHRGPVIHEH